jgi:hypothetical protein
MQAERSIADHCSIIKACGVEFEEGSVDVVNATC